MISLTAPTYDPAGVLVLHRARFRDAYQARRRGSITATLDGGAYPYDTGYSIADQVLTATFSHPTRDQLVRLRYLIALYPQLHIACEAGAFSAVCEFVLLRNTVTLTARLIRRLDG